MGKTDKEFAKGFDKSLKTIGVNLKRLRKMEGLEIAAVAKAVRIKVEVLTAIEAGTHEMRISQLERLCAYYQVTPADLFKRSGA
ncbi:helix-turn-helix domain-containing protein [Dawidia soli]|uniref:Helix-turn-helix domain-containing protein n=1 Tax=Dawidia soli TaxID=2782352 RepID=A0AAP2D5K1_9BACT|nr:helix-turn-helix transcriptional regulator [Dawidia soli]MBT1685454.1 helix-turn-helix domain-containing protein [Dawidia soli]